MCVAFVRYFLDFAFYARDGTKEHQGTSVLLAQDFWFPHVRISGFWNSYPESLDPGSLSYFAISKYTDLYDSVHSSDIINSL